MRKLKLSFPYISDPREQRGIHPTEVFLVNDLRGKANLDVYSVGDLVNTSDSYPEAIPVLMRHLLLMKDRNFLDGILRALTVKEARGIAFDSIYQMYIQDEDTNLYGAKAGMANALQFLAEKKDIPRIIDLALNQKNGSTRGYFIYKIASSANKNSVLYIKDVLEKLTKDTDKDIASMAQKALKRKKFQDIK
jgi:hypothetical protein